MESGKRTKSEFLNSENSVFISPFYKETKLDSCKAPGNNYFAYINNKSEDSVVSKQLSHKPSRNEKLKNIEKAQRNFEKFLLSAINSDLSEYQDKCIIFLSSMKSKQEIPNVKNVHNVYQEYSENEKTRKNYKSKNWNELELKLLIFAIIVYSCQERKSFENLNEENWGKISDIFANKTAQLCKFKYNALLRSHPTVILWTSEEDEFLKQIICEIKEEERFRIKWTDIAIKINNLCPNAIRVGKHCRERWNNHLNPSLIKGSWSFEEDLMILENSLSLGKKWAMISRNLPGRNENSVKNRFLALTKGIKIKGGKKKKADNFLKDSNVQEAIKQMILTLKKQIDQSLLYQSMEKLELNSPIFKLHHLLKSEQPTPMNFDTPLNVFQKGSLGASNTSGELLQNFSYAYKTSQNNRENYSNEDKTNNIPQNVLSFLEGNVTEEIIKNQEFQNNYKGNNTIDEKNSKNYKNQDLNTMKSASRNYNNQSNEVKDNFHNSKSWTANSQNSYNVNHATTNEKNSYQNFNNLWIQNPQNSFFTNQLNDDKIQVFNNFWREYEKKQNLMMSNYNNYMMFLSFMNSQAQTIPTYPNMENFQDTKKELNGNDANLSYLLSSPNENLRNTSLLVGGVNNSFNNNINEENRHMINERRNSASLESGYTSIHFPESRRSSAMNFSGVLSKSSSNNINSHSGISLEILNEEMNEKNLNKMEIENSTNIYPVNQQAPCQKNKKLMAYVVDEINESQKSQDKSKDISQSQIKDLSFPKPISIIDRKPTSLANFSPILFSKSSFNSLTLNFLGQDLFLSSPFLEKGHLNLGQFEGFDFGGMGIDLINNE